MWLVRSHAAATLGGGWDQRSRDGLRELDEVPALRILAPPRITKPLACVHVCHVMDGSPKALSLQPNAARSTTVDDARLGTAASAPNQVDHVDGGIRATVAIIW